MNFYQKMPPKPFHTSLENIYDTEHLISENLYV